MNHYPRNIGDYVRDTLGLSMQQDGAYTRLMDQYYAGERPLPLDHKELYGIARCRDAAERKAVDFVLKRFFVETPDGFRQKRCDVELEEMVAKSKSASRSAKKRWSERNANAYANASPDAYANALRTQSVGNARQEPRTINQEPGKAKTARKRAIPLPDNFGISDRVREWAAQKGHGKLEARLEHFLGYAKAHGKTYADWDESFMNAIRADWAKFNTSGIKGSSDERQRNREQTLNELTGGLATGRRAEPKIIDPSD